MLTAALVMTIISTIVIIVFAVTFKLGDEDTPKYSVKWIMDWMLTISTCILWGLIHWYYAIIVLVWLKFIVGGFTYALVNAPARGRRRKPEDFGLKSKKVDYL